VTKPDKEIMESLKALYSAGCLHSTARLVGCEHGAPPRMPPQTLTKLTRWCPSPLPNLIDGIVSKVEELVDTWRARDTVDCVHRRTRRYGFTGTWRTTRRAVAAAKTAGGPRAARVGACAWLAAVDDHRRNHHPGVGTRL